jgi:hypothetical protein
MRVICLVAIGVLSAAVSAIAAPASRLPHVLYVADDTPEDSGTAPSAAKTPPAGNGGVQLEIRPQQPPPPEKPPLDLSVPRERPTEPLSPPAANQPDREGDTSNAPPPAPWEADEPPRGEGAAIIPQETPSAIKAVEDWIRSWFP